MEPIHLDYVLHGHQLEQLVQTAKYLGFTISHDMCWNTHVDNIVKKGNQALSFLQRNHQIRRPEDYSLQHYRETPSAILQLCVGPSHTQEDPRDRDGTEKSSKSQCAPKITTFTCSSPKQQWSGTNCLMPFTPQQ